MRRHSWSLWAGITQTTQDGVPVWETWYPRDLALDPQEQTPRSFASRRTLEAPRQVQSADAREGSCRQALLSSILFNDPAYQHIRSLRYYDLDTYRRLLKEFDAAGTPPEERRIKPFPRNAIAVLTAWWHIKQSGLTALPVWDLEPTRPLAWGKGSADPSKRLLGNYPYTWKRFVAVDPGPRPVGPDESADVDFTYVDQSDRATKTVRKPGCRVVSINRFYRIEIRGAAVLKAAREALGDGVAEGDYAVLVGMHTATKELPEWVWSTFWWHDFPNDGRYAQGRPDAVTGVWRNYLMNAVYDFILPREYDGTPTAAFNPYIESHFANGPASNCMACHQRVAYPMKAALDGVQLFLPVTRGKLPPDGPYFADKVQLDYVWPLYLPGYEP
ncbi:MAG: hypothetical protein P4L84_20795 [Isosphaeraceae bacterium]|nr:hypothetical protein [Isosphaeraceae bacterium]